MHKKQDRYTMYIVSISRKLLQTWLTRKHRAENTTVLKKAMLQAVSGQE